MVVFGDFRALQVNPNHIVRRDHNEQRRDAHSQRRNQNDCLTRKVMNIVHANPNISTREIGKLVRRP